MKFGELFSKSLGDYEKNFKLILKSYFWFLFFPIIILTLIFLIWLIYFAHSFEAISGINIFSMTGSVIGGREGLGGLILFSFLFLILIKGVELISLFLSLWLIISVIYFAIYNEDGKMSFRESAKGSLKYFLPFIGLGILLTLTLFGLYLLFIIPGIIFTCYWLFSGYALVGENKGIVESMKRSKEVVKGNWWKVFGYTILLSLIGVIVFLAFSWPLFIFQILELEDTMNVITFVSIGYVLHYLSLIYQVIFVPFAAFFMKNFYLDLVKQKEDTEND